MEEAIQKNDISKIKVLLANGYGINSAEPTTHAEHQHIGYTPLSLSLMEQHTNITHFLLERGADVNARNSDGSTALIVALGLGDVRLETIRMLLDNNADPNLKDDSGATPLNGARGRQLTDITKLLVNRGAKDPFAEAVIWVPQIRGQTNELKRLLYGLAHGNMATNYLVIAAGDNDVVTAEKLLAAGADINRGDRIELWGSTPLSMAILRCHADMVVYLLDHGADINGRNRNGTTPLMQAVANREGSIELVRLLISRGADLNLKDSEGSSALDYATISRNTNAVELLKEAFGR
jgi:ankyrin repeat protein